MYLPPIFLDIFKSQPEWTRSKWAVYGKGREGKENTGIAKKGAGFWPWQKNVDLTKGSQAELYWKWLRKIFDPPSTPQKVVTTFPKRGLFPSIVKPPWYIIVVTRFAQTILSPPPTRKWKWIQLGKKLTHKIFHHYRPINRLLPPLWSSTL